LQLYFLRSFGSAEKPRITFLSKGLNSEKSQLFNSSLLLRQAHFEHLVILILMAVLEGSTWTHGSTWSYTLLMVQNLSKEGCFCGDGV